MSQSLSALHRKFAVECFNGTWELLDNAHRSPEDDLKMVHMTHASRYHWGEIGTPLEFARGDWQVSRVYSVLGMGENALKYAQSCLDLCRENNIGDFDLAFAYEALLRASAVLGDKLAFNQYKKFAQDASGKIGKEEDRDYFLSELSNIPGFEDS